MTPNDRMIPTYTAETFQVEHSRQGAQFGRVIPIVSLLQVTLARRRGGNKDMQYKIVQRAFSPLFVGPPTFHGYIRIVNRDRHSGVDFGAISCQHHLFA